MEHQVGWPTLNLIGPWDTNVKLNKLDFSNIPLETKANLERIHVKFKFKSQS